MMVAWHRITSRGSNEFSHLAETSSSSRAPGHFLQLEQPDAVARHIVDFIGRV